MTGSRRTKQKNNNKKYNEQKLTKLQSRLYFIPGKCII